MGGCGPAAGFPVSLRRQSWSYDPRLPNDAASLTHLRPLSCHSPILVRGGTPQHTLYPAKGPVLPRGPGRSPGRKFWPLQRHFNAKNHVPMTYSTLFESSRRDLRDSGHTGVVRWGKRMAQGARGRAGRVRARAPRRMRGARAGRGRGAPWAGLVVGRAEARPTCTAVNCAGLEPGAQQLSCKPAAL